MNNFIVDKNRIHPLNNVASPGRGGIFYLMSREQRLDDNWGFLHAVNLAALWCRDISVIYVFSAADPLETSRQFEFRLGGLKEVEQRADKLNISFRVFTEDDISGFIARLNQEEKFGAVVCDFDPLRSSLTLNKNLAAVLDVPVIEVDSHNIVPCRIASPKQEFGAHTLRKKIESVLPQYLTPFPMLEDVLEQRGYKGLEDKNNINWDKIIKSYNVDSTVMPVQGLPPGFKAGSKRLQEFIDYKLNTYDEKRNDPTLQGQSGLSAYLHFGQISPQTAALSAAQVLGGLPLKGGFLDELIVRRELSDNFCLYNPDYDSFLGFPSWAKLSLNLHASDRREYLYTLSELETSATHDPLWNAAQKQMVYSGIMHGYMRMYWAKKILEWSPDSSEAMRRAVYLNDRYSLDGRDPNGYSGCAWSIGGLHDRAWGDRSVFGKVRYMNDKGCRRKFDTGKYIKQQEDPQWELKF